MYLRSRASGIFLLHAGVFAILASWSWLRWPDPLIDFGRELYVPWQLTQGKVLYRDIESIFGPLSPYLNALWMRLFGVSLLTLAICNLILFAITLAGIYHLIRRATDRFTASAATLAALILCGFLQLVQVGNYNFVTPYAHEATHGLAISVGLMLAWHAALVSGRLRFAALGGLLFGAAVLTKPEILLAAGAAVVAGVAMSLALRITTLRTLGTLLAAFAVSAATLPALFFVYLRSHMPDIEALDGVFGAVTSAMNADIATNTFYVAGMGFDRPVRNALRMLLAFGAFAAFAAAVIAVSSSAIGRRLSGTARTIAGTILVGGAVLAQPLGVVRGLPLITLCALAGIVILLHRTARDRDTAARHLLLCMWGVYALALLLKMVLSARLHHYGFYLALPALTLLIVALSWLIPSVLAGWFDPPALRRFRRLVATACAAATVPFLATSYVAYRAKTTTIGSGSDRFHIEAVRGSRGAVVAESLAAITSVASPNDKLAVLPEGVIVNYLLRLESPLRVVNFMPPELAMFGEDEVLGALARNRPRFFLFVHKDTTEYGYGLFGSDRRYGARTLQWVAEHYRPIRTIGERPLEATGYGAVLFERRD